MEEQRYYLNALFFFAETNSERSKLLKSLEKELYSPATTIDILPDIELSLSSIPTHDTLILQTMFTSNAEAQPWESLQTAYNQILGWIIDTKQEKIPWAVSCIFHLCFPPGENHRFLHETAYSLSEYIQPGKPPGKQEKSPYGWFWSFEDGFVDQQRQKTWQRDLLLITPQARTETVDALFLNHPHQGLIRLELYLQKCKHLARQHNSIRETLNRDISLLREEMLEHLVASDFNRIHEEPRLMEKMSRQLMRFLTQKATVEILLNSLRSNQVLFSEHLERVKLESQHYEKQQAWITRQVEQIENDLQNVDVVQESVYLIQDIQRGAEASRFERASYLLGYTAALLAGISLFNSFLDIWSLVLENSSWMLPDAWLRITLSLVGSVAIPLAATWLIARRKWHAMIAMLVSLLTVIAMFLVTILSNL